MSGGHFNYNQSLISEIADTIATEIARALLPKPAKVHEDYWTIDEHDCPCCCHNYCSYHEFKTYAEAESYLLSDKSIVPVDHNYDVSFISKEDKVFRSTKLLMGGTKDAEPIPWLYSIHHCVFDHYPYDADVLELNEETIETMKQAYLQLRKAYVYAQRVDWMLSGDDGRTQCKRDSKKNWIKFSRNLTIKTGPAPMMDGMKMNKVAQNASHDFLRRPPVCSFERVDISS